MIRFRQIHKILDATEKPRQFAPAHQEFWENRYIQRHVLNAHLDPDAEDGSRKHRDIRESVDWIHGKLGHPGLMLDLGCGPGLYAERFASLGWKVTGMDFSRASVRYAKTRARKTGSVGSCRYFHRNYLTADLPGNQDLVTLIYGNFCVLSVEDQVHVLRKIRAALKPSGHLVLDVFTKRYVEKHRNRNEWYALDKSGFWSRGGHLVLADSVEYGAGATLNRYTVVPSFGRVRTYHLWYHYTTAQKTSDLLEQHGFEDVEWYGDLRGTPYDEDGEWIGIVTRKGG